MLLLPLALMFLGTFLLGQLPLLLPLSAAASRVLEVLGAGLLCGAAMTVVIPEGTAALFRAQHKAAEAAAHGVAEHAAGPVGAAAQGVTRLGSRMVALMPRHAHDVHAHDAEPRWNAETLLGATLLAGFLVMFIIDQITSPSSGHDSHGHHHGAGHAHARLSRSFSSMHSQHAHGHSHSHSHAHGSGHAHSGTTESGSSSSSEDLAESGHGTGGARSEALRLVRSGSASGSGSASSLGERYKAAASTGSTRDGAGANEQRSSSGISSRSEPQPQGMRAAFASVAGLVIHAAADGIAMGASARSDDESLKIVVWLAIMIHKAPAAFGLCTLLMSQHVARSDIRRAVFIFALSTPLGALLTYFLLSYVLSGTVSEWQIGCALTFSGGTFLFVAMHAVGATSSSDADVAPASPSASSASASAAERERDVEATLQAPHRPRYVLGKSGRIAVLLMGSLLPRTLQSLVGHGH